MNSWKVKMVKSHKRWRLGHLSSQVQFHIFPTAWSKTVHKNVSHLSEQAEKTQDVPTMGDLLLVGGGQQSAACSKVHLGPILRASKPRAVYMRTLDTGTLVERPRFGTTILSSGLSSSVSRP